MRRKLVLALAACSMACFAACSVHGPAGPAWPRPSAREVDGGESLAPRAAARAIAAIVEEDHPADRAGADKPAAAPVPAASAASAAPAGAPPAQDEPLPSEEIVIEVDD
jgi:hypothetical protein